MLFQNPVIDTEELPAVESVEFRRLSPAYRAVSYISTLIFFVFLSVGWGLFYLLSQGVPEWITTGSLVALLVLFVLSMVLVNSRYRMAGYALRAHDIMYKSGVFWHSTTVIPYSRIQHVEISQGPIQSAFGIATLRIYTAGGTRSDLTIEGLERKRANEIKEFITGKVAGIRAAESEQPVAPLRSEEKKAEGTEDQPAG
jgi:hypothetical protein